MRSTFTGYGFRTIEQHLRANDKATYERLRAIAKKR